MTLEVPVGLLYSTQGTYKHMGLNAYHGATYAIAQINQSKAFDFMLVEHHYDPKGQLDDYICAVQSLLDQDISHIFGTITSSSRKEILPDIYSSQGMLWYASPYEGYECDEHVAYLGSCPNQSLHPLLSYAIPTFGKRAALIASNYIWGWESNRIASEVLSTVNGEVVLERYFRLDSIDYSETINELTARAPDFIINNLVGESCYAFLEQLNARWSGEAISVLSCNLTECELVHLPQYSNIRLITAASFFESVDPNFVSTAKRHLGDVPISAYFMSAYLAVYAFAHAMNISKTPDVAQIKAALQQVSLSTEQNGARLQNKLTFADNQHAHLPCYIAEWQGAEKKFEILRSLERIAPNPYLTAHKSNIDQDLLGVFSSTKPMLRLIS